jgi:hypothetical protein
MGKRFVKSLITAKLRAFADHYCKLGNSTQAAIAIGVIESNARRWGCTSLNDARVQEYLASKPPITISAEAAYDRAQATIQYNKLFEIAVKCKNTDSGREIVDSLVKMHGLILQPSEVPTQPGGIVNNIYSLASDDDLYELLKQKREAGHGIDTESIGHDIAGLAKKIPQDHRQAEPVTPAAP